jgi:hypothetical protein
MNQHPIPSPAHSPSVLSQLPLFHNLGEFISIELEASGDGWDFYLDSDVSRGHHRTVVGTLDTETVYGNQRSWSSTYWVLTLNHAWGTSTISNRTSISSNTGGSIVALADGSFGTYVFTRSINAAGQGTSPWSGEQSKRIEFRRPQP